jgi:hypothetical protein
MNNIMDVIERAERNSGISELQRQCDRAARRIVDLISG